MNELQRAYQRRLGEDLEFRREMYRVLCSRVFQKRVPEESTVVDIAAGYCEFINNISARRKIAVDLNPDTQKYAAAGVEVIQNTATDLKALESDSVDVAFTSNFLEHLNRDEIRRVMQEVHRVLKNRGRFLILQPNIRYCYKDYWMFFDHITPLDDRSLSEALELHGFRIAECKPRFLPFTTKGRLPKSIFLLKLYLQLPLAQRLFGAQAYVVAEKDAG